MTDYPYEGEVQLLGYAWNPDDGPWIRIRLDEIAEMAGGPHPFNGLKKGREKGQRMKMRFDLIADDETTTEAPAETERPKDRTKRPWDEVAPREQACIRCNEDEFRAWLADYMNLTKFGLTAKDMLCQYLGIKSRTAIVPGSEIAKWWDSLDQEYQDYIGQRRDAAQLMAGPH